MKRIDRKRREALQKIQDMAVVLTKDLEIASEQLIEAKKDAKPTAIGKLDLAYAGKTALRTLFSHVDGMAYTLRSIAVEYAEELGVQIPDQERLSLQELRGPKDGKPAQARPSPIENFKIALKYFPALFGVERELDLSSDHAKAFLALADIRREIAHPKTLEDLSDKDFFSFWLPGSLWYLAQVSDLLQLCAQQIPDTAPAFPNQPLPDYQHTERAGATDDEKAAEPTSLRNLEPMRKALDLLESDTSRAMGVSTKMAGIDDLMATYGQYGLRNLLRTVVYEAEATLAITTLFLAAFLEWSELDLSDQDVEDLRSRNDLDEKLLEIANFWSTEIGNQKQKKTGGKKWDMFRQTFKVRDRVTHPRSPKDLRISLDETSIILGAQDWVRDLADLLDIDPEKWAKYHPEKAAPEQAVPEPGK
jgi:hypothetical protein